MTGIRRVGRKAFAEGVLRRPGREQVEQNMDRILPGFTVETNRKTGHSVV